MKKLVLISAAAMALLICTNNASALVYDQDVTSNVIMGSGIGNGSWTVDRSNGVELGLRGKTRYNASGIPDGTYNSNGDGTYTFDAGVAPTQSSTSGKAIWSFEWSVNSDFDGTSGYKLEDLTYSLSMVSTTGASIASFDLINADTDNNGSPYWDHSIGDNTTAQSAGVEAATESEYVSLIANNNLAQNSWQTIWYCPTFDPTAVGEYYFTLTAFDNATAVASTTMTIQAVPEPATMALLGLGGLLLRRRKR